MLPVTTLPTTYTTGSGWVISDPVAIEDIPRDWLNIGSGSTRNAYLSECGKVVKVLNVKYGNLNRQCAIERSIWETACPELRPYLARCYAAGETFCVMEHAPAVGYGGDNYDLVQKLKDKLLSLRDRGLCLNSLLTDLHSDNIGLRPDGSLCVIDYGYY